MTDEAQRPLNRLFRSIGAAAQLCASTQLRPEHVLAGIAAATNTTAGRRLHEHGVTVEAIRTQIDAIDANLIPATLRARDEVIANFGEDAWARGIRNVPFSPTGKDVINLALMLAGQSDPDAQNVFECALLVCAAREGAPRRIIQAAGVDPDELALTVLAGLAEPTRKIAFDRLAPPAQ